jgi:hypothetical protein
MLIRMPASWPEPFIALVAMLVLAVLDLGGAYAAKEAAVRRSPLMAGLGVVLFVGLFWVYASSLQYAELGLVTLGWVVLLQVGVLMLDRYRYDTHLPTGKWVAVVVILAAQVYLVVGPAGAAGADQGTAPSAGPRHRATAWWRPGRAAREQPPVAQEPGRESDQASRSARGPDLSDGDRSSTLTGWTVPSPSSVGWYTRC